MIKELRKLGRGKNWINSKWSKWLQTKKFGYNDDIDGVGSHMNYNTRVNLALGFKVQREEFAVKTLPVLL